MQGGFTVVGIVKTCNTSILMTPENIRDMLMERLHKKGWVTGTWTKDIAPNIKQSRIEFTEEGKKKMLQLHALFDELGLMDAHITGEFHVLWEVCRQCEGQQGAKSKGS